MLHSLLYPKNKDVERLLENFYKMNIPYNKALSTKPDIARELSRYKTIRNLSRSNLVNIIGKSGSGSSWVVFDADIKIVRKTDSIGRVFYQFGFK